MQRIDILWRDIPSQVLIAYLDEWRRVTTAIEGEGALTDIATQLGQEIEAQYSDEDITRLAKQNGYAEPAT